MTVYRTASITSIKVDGEELLGVTELSYSEHPRDSAPAPLGGRTSGQFEATFTLTAPAAKTLLAALEDEARERRRLARRAVYRNRGGRSALRRLRKRCRPHEVESLLLAAHCARAKHRVAIAMWRAEVDRLLALRVQP